MKNRILFQPLYFLFWLLYFVVARAVFLLYHLDRSAELTSHEVINTFIYGLRLDASFAAYICILPFLLLLLTSLWQLSWVSKALRYYTYVLLGLLSFLLSVDLELYSHWGFRLDASPLQYLHSPAEMAASAAGAPLFLLFIVTLAIAASFSLLYLRLFDLGKYKFYPKKWLASVLSLVFAALLVLPLRGGWQQIPINQSVVYFSDKPFANHAGLNMPWNLMHAMLKYDKSASNPYQYMPEQEAKERVAALYNAVSADSAAQLLRVRKPNVLFIILESYTAKFVGSLGGEKGVTPNLDRLAAEGISFTNIYAGGDRSEKGMVALLSGYPVQTTTSIIKYPQKTEKMPQLSRVFRRQGYSTSYYYGGELEFANIKSYLRNGHYNRLIDKYDFDPSTYNSKWGAHDHVLFERVQRDLKQEQQPFFSTVYTLSSHEPFEIPIPAAFPGTDEEALYRNSVHYTDWALGKFIKEAKQQEWWQQTLVIITADHGHRLPGNDPNHAPSKFRIPFILTGGALAKGGVIFEGIGSQTDIAATLLAQLQWPHQQFTWSRNLLAPTTTPFAFYVFNDGFGFITPQGVLTYDNVSKKPILKEEGVTEEQLENGQAYMQASFEDFVKK
ncbi:LTA synthase family protein [Pontibacter mangrovi]|uniref:LTA synthase family protein n=1 Tax=Pontibacter mangrovi TaxID=2589816 RepID=A0A501WF39_9BACT|nr:LTA synthase family protein [Pontibacter mangrovi]TPE45801.1 LTA synthase family protein [Pontibacter mangrovi]